MSDDVTILNAWPTEAHGGRWSWFRIGSGGRKGRFLYMRIRRTGIDDARPPMVVVWQEEHSDGTIFGSDWFEPGDYFANEGTK